MKIKTAENWDTNTRQTGISGYVLFDLLGTGAFAEVRVGVRISTGQRVAVKKVSLARGLQKSIDAEIHVLRQINHEHVISLLDVVEETDEIGFDECGSPDHRKVCLIVEELALGGELYEIISQTGPFSKPFSRYYFRQLISAVQHLHERGISHLDIKPENIVFSSNFSLKLVDFGLAIQPDSTMAGLRCQSSVTQLNSYTAPEMINPKNGPGPMCDIWSCAVVLYVMLKGKPPFRRPLLAPVRNMSPCKHFAKLMSGKYSKTLSSNAKHLFSNIFKIDPNERYSLDQIRKSDFFREDSLPSWNEVQYQMNIRAQKAYEILGKCSVSRLLTLSRTEGLSCEFSESDSFKNEIEKSIIPGEKITPK